MNMIISKKVNQLIEKIKIRQNDVHQWLGSYEENNELPIYSSVDIRNSGFKMAVVDTNLFPAGFNNLCEHGLKDSVHFIKQAIEKRAPHGKDILIIAEEHTRNTWYLENIRILQTIIVKAGFNVKIATFLTVQPDFCDKEKFVELETATGEQVQIYCFKQILEDYKSGREHFDLIVMNNDLTTGIPDFLKCSKVPIYPSIAAGWHSRQKSYHFQYTNDLIKEFAHILEMDPWIFSSLFSVVKDVNINDAGNREQLMDTASDLLGQVGAKYEKHGIFEKPYLVMKSDSGTYGMGVMMIEDPTEIIQLNRKGRNKLYKGKSSQVIDRYLLQEGIPTMYADEKEVREVCIYQIESNLVGGFYRSHGSKTKRDNLNSQGAEFKKMCPHLSKYGDCGVRHDINIFDIYRILARIASIAAHREIIDLEATKPKEKCYTA